MQKKLNYNSLIDEYAIITIPRSIRRQYLMLGNLMTMRVPYEKIMFYAGADAKDYNHKIETVADAAIEDGYDFLRQFSVGLKDKYIKQSAGNLALFWNWVRILKHIYINDITCVLSWDDRFLQVPYDILEEIVAELYSREEEFLFLQMHLRGPKIALGLCGHTEKKQSSKIFYNTINSRVDSYYDLFLQKGIFGYDETMVITPAGANFLFNIMVNMEDLTKEVRDHKFAHLDPTTEEELERKYRSRLNNDNYLCWGTKLHIEEALSQNKGIYSPKHTTYTFVNEPIDNGSDVVWQADYDTTSVPPRTTIPMRQI